MRYILLGAPHALKNRKIFSVNVKPRNAVPISRLDGKLFERARVDAAAQKLEVRGDRGVFFSKHGKPYVMQRTQTGAVAYAPKRVWTSATFLVREFFRLHSLTKTSPGEIEAVLLMKRAPKDMQLGHAVSIKSMFQARLLIDSGAITEDEALATLHSVAKLVDEGPYKKSPY